MSDAIFKILRCKCGKQEYHSSPEKTPPPCPRCAAPRSYSDKWHIKIWVDGKRRITAVSGNRKFAEKALEKAEAERFQKEYLPEAPKAPLLSQAIETIYQERWRRGKDGEKSRRRAEMFMEIIGDIPLDQINSDQLRKLHAAMAVRENSDTTGNRYLAALKTILRRFDLSTRLITMAAETNRIKTYTKKEEVEILAHLDNEPYTGIRSGWADLPDLVRILRDTGARLSEILQLHERDLDLESGAIRLFNTKHGGSRTIYMVGDARKILTSRTGKGKLFAIGIDQADKAWERVREQLGIDDPDAVLHTWRHTSCTRMLEAGENPVLVQKWHGHSTITTTMRYIHYLDDHLKEAAKRLNSVNKTSTERASD